MNMTRKLRFYTWFSIIILAAFAVGYSAWTKATLNWPFDQTFYPYPETPKNSPSPSLTKRGEGGELKDWKTYRNEEYGFELRYPSKYESSRYGGSLLFVANEKGAPRFSVSIYKNPGELTVEKYYEIKQKQANLLDVSAYKTGEFQGSDGWRIVLYQGVPDMVANDMIVAGNGKVIVEFLAISTGKIPVELVEIAKSVKFN